MKKLLTLLFVLSSLSGFSQHWFKIYSYNEYLGLRADSFLIPPQDTLQSSPIGSFAIKNNHVYQKLSSGAWSQVDGGGNAVQSLSGSQSIQYGTFAAMPSPGTLGRFYAATDSSSWFLDNGVAWLNLSGSGGGGGTPGNPTQSITFGPAINGSASTFMRSDAKQNLDSNALNLHTGGYNDARFLGQYVTLNSVAALNAYVGVPGVTIKVKGWHFVGDGFIGTYIWNASSTATPVPGVVVQLSGFATGRYLFEWSGNLFPAIAIGLYHDGVTSDSANMQKAFNYASSIGAGILLPNGTILSRFTVIPAPGNMIIKGSGNTKILGITSSSIADMSIFDLQQGANNVTIEDLELDMRNFAGGPPGGNIGIRMLGDTNCVFRNLYEHNNTYIANSLQGACYNILFDHDICDTTDGCIQFIGSGVGSKYVEIASCVFKNGTSEGVQVEGNPSAGLFSSHINIHDSWFINKVNSNGIIIWYGKFISVTGCHFINCNGVLGSSGFTQADQDANITFENNIVDSIVSDALGDMGDNFTCVGNQFSKVGRDLLSMVNPDTTVRNRNLIFSNNICAGYNTGANANYGGLRIGNIIGGKIHHNTLVAGASASTTGIFSMRLQGWGNDSLTFDNNTCLDAPFVTQSGQTDKVMSFESNTWKDFGYTANTDSTVKRQYARNNNYVGSSGVVAASGTGYLSGLNYFRPRDLYNLTTSPPLRELEGTFVGRTIWIISVVNGNSIITGGNVKLAYGTSYALDSASWIMLRYDGINYNEVARSSLTSNLYFNNKGTGYPLVSPHDSNVDVKSLGAGTNVTIDSNSIPGRYIINATGGGGGSPNTSVGSGYPVAITGTNNVKSLTSNTGTGVKLDSLAANQVNISNDTTQATGVAMYHDLNDSTRVLRQALAGKQATVSLTTNPTTGSSPTFTSSTLNVDTFRYRKIWNPKDFGAKGDGQEHYVSSMTTGSPTLTCTDCSFTAGDVGKICVVDSASGSGKPLLTAITGFTNSTTVTVSFNAFANVSNMRVVYGTDDTQAWQNTLNACFYTGGGGTIFAPNGLYIIAGALQTSFNGANPNAQLCIPAADSSRDPNRGTIEIVGETGPNWVGNDPFNAVSYWPSKKGTVLLSTINGSGVAPSVIGSQAPSTSFANINYANLITRNFTILTQINPSGFGPTVGGINAGKMATYYCEGMKVEVDGIVNNGIEPTADIAGIIYPFFNDESMNMGKFNLVIGYRYGFVHGEHTNSVQEVAYGCYAAHAFTRCTAASHCDRIESQWNKWDIYIPGGTIVGQSPGAVYLSIDQLEVEALTTAYLTRWYNYQGTINDSSNLGKGYVQYDQNCSNNTCAINANFLVKGAIGIYTNPIVWPYQNINAGTLTAIGTSVAGSTTNPISAIASDGNRVSVLMQNTNSAGAAGPFFTNNNGAASVYGYAFAAGSAFSGSNLFGLSRVNSVQYIGDGAALSAMMVGNLQNVPLVFGTNNAERARFTGAGKFLVGQTADSSTGLLQINGASWFADSVDMKNIRDGNTSDSVAVLHQLSAGKFVVHKVAQSSIGGSSFYQTVQSNTTSQTQRAKLNFSTDFTVADNSGNGSTDVSISTSKLTSGTYTPTVSGVANYTSNGTIPVFKYERNGNTVTVHGRIFITPSAALTVTEFSVTLPIATTTISSSDDMYGEGTSVGTSTYSGAFVRAVPGAPTIAVVSFMSESAGSGNVHFSFVYTVN